MIEVTSRTWLGIIVGIIWGLVLGYFFKSGDMTGPWLLGLLGPPLVFLVAPKHPILSWQTPLVTGAIFGNILARDKGDTGSGGPPDTLGSVLLMSFLSWVLVSVISCPWPFIFQRRTPKEVQAGAPKTEAAPGLRVAAVLAVFVACAVVLAGFVSLFYPIELDRYGHFYGLLLIALGVTLSVGMCHLADKFGIGERVKEVLALPLIFGGAFCGLSFVVSLLSVFWVKPHQPLSTEEASFVLAALEAAAGLLWLRKTKKSYGRTGASAL